MNRTHLVAKVDPQPSLHYLDHSFFIRNQAKLKFTQAQLEPSRSEFIKTLKAIQKATTRSASIRLRTSNFNSPQRHRVHKGFH